jgi:hypothetical protein
MKVCFTFLLPLLSTHFHSNVIQCNNNPNAIFSLKKNNSSESLTPIKMLNIKLQTEWKKTFGAYILNKNILDVRPKSQLIERKGY